MENFQYFKKHYPAAFELVEEGGQVYVGISDKPWIYFDFFHLLGEQNMNTLTRLLDKIPSSYNNFALVEDWMLPLIDPHQERMNELHCNRYQLDWEDYLDCDDAVNPMEIYASDANITIQPLTIEDAGIIQNSHDYNEYTDLAYVRKRIEMGTHAGVKRDGDLVAWAITHDDGAIGFLFVNPQYRGRGYGKLVIRTILDALKKKGLNAYVHVEAENKVSLTLFISLGFKFDRSVRWFEMPK